MAIASTLAAVLFVAPASGGSSEQRRPVDGRVAVRDNFFSPRSLTIQSGEIVKWTWKGDNRHDLAFTKLPKGASRRGAAARSDGRWYRKFRKPGQYRYVCTLFAGMRGSVTVVDAEPSSREPAGLP